MEKTIRIGLSFLTTVLCFSSIYIVHYFFFNMIKEDCLIAAFGAAAVLAFSTKSTQQYSIKVMFGGAVLGATIGVWASSLPIDKIGATILAISVCMTCMEWMELNYPPGGAIALIPIVVEPNVHSLGYGFVFFPVLVGISLIFLFSRLQKIINNKL